MANGNMARLGAGAAMTGDGFAAAPPAQPTLVLAPASDSGTTEDDITNDTTPTLNGFAVSGSLITIYDGATQLAQTTAAGDGSWSVTLPVLSAGAHTLTAVSTVAGEDSAPSDALSLTIDAQAPTFTTETTRLAADRLRLTLTFDETPVGFSAADIAPPNAATVQNFTATGNPRVFTLEVEIGHPRVMSTNIDMLAGAYTDAAGNASAASSLTIPGWDQQPQPEPEVMVVDGVPVQRVIYDAGPLQPREVLTVPILPDNGRSGNTRDDLDLPVGDATMKVPRGMGGEVSLNDNLCLLYTSPSPRD